MWSCGGNLRGNFEGVEEGAAVDGDGIVGTGFGAYGGFDRVGCSGRSGRDG